MRIECTLKRAEPVVISIGNETYTFEEDDDGRRVCEVWKEDHINAFLAVSHLYRDADAPVEPSAPAGAPLDGGDEAVLLSRAEIMAALRERGITFKAIAKTGELRALLATAKPGE